MDNVFCVWQLWSCMFFKVCVVWKYGLGTACDGPDMTFSCMYISQWRNLAMFTVSVWSITCTTVILCYAMYSYRYPLYINMRAPAAMARRNLSTVAKNLTEHFVNLNTDYLTLCKLNKAAFLKYVDLSSINIKISLSLPEPMIKTGMCTSHVYMNTCCLSACTVQKNNRSTQVPIDTFSYYVCIEDFVQS